MQIKAHPRVPTALSQLQYCGISPVRIWHRQQGTSREGGIHPHLYPKTKSESGKIQTFIWEAHSSFPPPAIYTFNICNLLYRERSYFYTQDSLHKMNYRQQTGHTSAYSNQWNFFPFTSAWMGSGSVNTNLLHLLFSHQDIFLKKGNIKQVCN